MGLALTICGANNLEIQALEFTERLNTLAALGRLSSDDVTQLVSRLEKRAAPNNVSIPTAVVLNIQGLCFWAARARRQGRIVLAGEFGHAELQEALDAMEIQAEKNTAPEIKPSALKEENWEDWSQEFPTYLSHILGKQQAPLDYVIRPDLDPTHVFASRREEELYSSSKEGNGPRRLISTPKSEFLEKIRRIKIFYAQFIFICAVFNYNPAFPTKSANLGLTMHISLASSRDRADYHAHATILMRTSPRSNHE